MIGLILMLVIVGVLLYVVETYIPMAQPMKLVIRIVVIICVVLYLLQLFGIADLPIPRAR